LSYYCIYNNYLSDVRYCFIYLNIIFNIQYMCLSTYNVQHALRKQLA